MLHGQKIDWDSGIQEFVHLVCFAKEPNIETTHAKRSKGFLEIIANLKMLMTPTVMPPSRDSVYITLPRHEFDNLMAILDNNTTDNLCMVNTPDECPVFVLVAKDKFFSSVIRKWADFVESAWVNSKERKPSTKTKIMDARLCAAEGDKWPNIKIPD